MNQTKHSQPPVLFGLHSSACVITPRTHQNVKFKTKVISSLSEKCDFLRDRQLFQMGGCPRGCFKSLNFFSGVQEVEPLPFAPILGTLHFAPSETESGQLVKGPASLKIDKLEGLTETIRIETTGRNDQMHKKWVSKQVHTAAKLMPDK